MQILKVVVSDYWFDEIKSGRKTHEYRYFSDYWKKRLTFVLKVMPAYLVQGQKGPCFTNGPLIVYQIKPYSFIEFQRAYRKNPERMTFKIKKIDLLESGKDSDLKCNSPVFDIQLGERVK